MEKRYKRICQITVFLLCMIYLCGFMPMSMKEDNYATRKVALAADKWTSASAFYDTYWIMRSYTGTFNVVFYSNGTCFSAAPGETRGQIRDLGTWSYANGILTLDGNQYIKRTDGKDTWFVYEYDGWSIGLYEDQNAAGFDAVEVCVFGEPVSWRGEAPYVDNNNRTMVPLRPVAEAMDLDVDWDQKTQTATFTGRVGYDDEIMYERGGGGLCTGSVSFRAGSKTAFATYQSPDSPPKTGKRTIQMDTALVVRNGRTYAPIRYLAEAFGYSADWNKERRSIEMNWALIENPF